MRVAVAPSAFDPARQGVTITFGLTTESRASVKIFDADRRLVRTLANKARRSAGAHRESWDGRDVDGNVVSNEAYFFTIEATDRAGNTAVYDPITFSGGESGDIRIGEVDRSAGTVSYQLSQPSRVLLRAGVTGSAMLKTIVDWEPRAAGTVTEYWNGKDENNLIDLLGRKHTMILTYTTLPENSVITYGNAKTTDRAAADTGRPMKPDRPMVNQRRISPHFLKSRRTDRAFAVNLSFPELPTTAGEVPRASGRVIVRLEIDPKDREVLQDQQFEIILFVDTVFHAEEERGYLPFNAPIELTDLPAGDHVITANIITYGDQIGVGSRTIHVAR